MTSTPETHESKTLRPQLPRLIAHRGASAYTPENTLIAMRKAKALGATWVEFDVTLTGDGEAIVIHDETLNRTTNGHGTVAHKDYADIAKLDAGTWFHPQFSGERVPTLVEMIDCLAELGLNANIELKPALGREEDTARKTMMLLHEHWPESAPLPLISSRDIIGLEVMREMDEQLPIGLITDRLPKGWLRIANLLDCVSIHLKHSKLDEEQVADILKTGREVAVYTVNEAARAAKLFSWGITSIFSDDPSLLNGE